MAALRSPAEVRAPSADSERLRAAAAARAAARRSSSSVVRGLEADLAVHSCANVRLPRPWPETMRPGGRAAAPAALDAIAETTLWRFVVTCGRGDRPLTELAGMVAGLLAADALEPGSPAVAARLVALARRLSIGLPAGFPAPPQWTSPSPGPACRGARPPGRPSWRRPAAAVLPEIDGAQFALAELHSAAESSA